MHAGKTRQGNARLRCRIEIEWNARRGKHASTKVYNIEKLTGIMREGTEQKWGM